MPEGEKKKKIIGLRTFADDMKRARGGHVGVPPATEAPKKLSGKTLANDVTDELAAIGMAAEPPKPKPIKRGFFGRKKKMVPEVPIPSVSSKPPTPPIQRPADIEQEEPPMDIPPFHHIRASSPDDTTFNDAREVHRNSKQKSTRVPKPKQNEVKPATLGIDTGEIESINKTILGPARDAVFDTEEAMLDVGEGTIVTDRKREKFKVVPAVGEAVTDWIEDKVDDVEDARRPKHEIIKSSRRKDVITAAAKNAKLAPTDDHARVKKRLEQVERITETEDLEIKSEEEVPVPTWSHTEGGDEAETTLKAAEEAVAKEEGVHTPETSISEDDETLSVAPTPEGEYGRRVSMTSNARMSPSLPSEPVTQGDTPVSEPAISTPGFTTQETPTSEEAYEAVSVPAPAPLTAPEPEPEQVIPPVPESTPVSQPPAALPTAQPEPVLTDEQPIFARNPVPAYRLDRTGQPIPTQAGTPYLTLVAVAIVAIVLGIGATTLWFGQSDTSKTVTTPPAPALITAQTSARVPLSTNRTEFYNALSSTAANSGTVVIELEPTIGGIPASTEQIFSALAWSAPSNFVRNVSQISFGYAASGAPFIVLRTNSFDVAFGGILAWEQYMTTDLAPLFGPALKTNSYDTKISNHDIRILTSDGYSDTLVYGFIDKHTILITPNRDVFAEIEPSIKK